MGIFSRIDMSNHQGLKDRKVWAKVVPLMLAAVVWCVAVMAMVNGGVRMAYDHIVGQPEATEPLPTPPAFEDYVLAFPEDPVWSKIIDAPSPEYRASINLSTLHKVTVVGGFESQKPFPMECKLPTGALVWPFGKTSADGQEYVLAEYGGQEPVDDGAEGITMYTVPGGCQIGTLFAPTDDMKFAGH